MITRDKQGVETEWIFLHEAIAADSVVLKAWETCRIDSTTASKRMAHNTHWETAPNRSELQQLANGFGYSRMPDEFLAKHNL
jgi:hypothetical protein